MRCLGAMVQRNNGNVDLPSTSWAQAPLPAQVQAAAGIRVSDSNTYSEDGGIPSPGSVWRGAAAASWYWS